MATEAKLSQWHESMTKQLAKIEEFDHNADLQIAALEEMRRDAENNKAVYTA